MTRISEITAFLEEIAPKSLQEDYDNSGLIVGNHNSEVTGVLVCLDSTEGVVDEAIEQGCNLIISHHPIIFRGLKKLTGDNYVERSVIKAIKNDISIYALHTNLDNVDRGVNAKIAQLLELENVKILAPRDKSLHKLVTFVPEKNTQEILEAIHEAGAGRIGKYDYCSFSVRGTGSFRPGDQSQPHLGTPGHIETVDENRIEVIFSSHLWPSVWKALSKAHPYEEVAYYLTQLDNSNQEVGSGMIGELKNEMSASDFLSFVKEKFALTLVKHTTHGPDKIKVVGVCGGAGSFLTSRALLQGADAFITSDIKYHEFFDAEDKMLLLDVGHYESEVHTKELIGDFLRKKFNTFAVQLAKTNTNPVSYS